MQTKVIGVIVAVFMATPLFGGMVSAKSPVIDYEDEDVVRQLVTDLANASDYVAAYLALSAEEQAAVTTAMTGTGSVTEAYTVLADQLRHTKVYEHKTNKWGWKIATYWSSTYWCWDGDEIVGIVIFKAGGSVAWWARQLWEYAGHHYKEEDFDYARRQWHADRASGHFKECIIVPVPGRLPGIRLCYDSPTFMPVINKWQYADGTRRHESWQ